MFCFIESYCITQGIDHFGNDVAVIGSVFSFTHCQWECQQNDACVAFGYDMNIGRCVLKSQENPNANDAVASGPKFCNSIQSKQYLDNFPLKNCIKLVGIIGYLNL